MGRFGSIAFTPRVQAEQEKRGSRRAYQAAEKGLSSQLDAQGLCTITGPAGAAGSAVGPGFVRTVWTFVSESVA